mgnify:CR=1 FL=1
MLHIDEVSIPGVQVTPTTTGVTLKQAVFSYFSAIKAKLVIVIASTWKLVRRYPIRTVMVGAVALLANVFTIFGGWEPNLVAVMRPFGPSKIYPQGKWLTKGKTFVMLIDLSQRFKNDSLRGGAYVKEIRFDVTSIDDAVRPKTELKYISTEKFGSFEEKDIKFIVLVYVDVTKSDSIVPFEFACRFIDNSGATINDQEGNPYWRTQKIYPPPPHTVERKAT